jgi:hypothetical protein
MFGHFLCGLLRLRELVEPRLERILRLLFFHIRARGVEAAMQLLVHVDVRLERERGVQNRLDALCAGVVDRLLDAVRVRRGHLDDVGAGLLVEAREKRVVLRKVRVPEHMRGDERVLGDRVAVHEVGMARVAGEHHLEDPRMPHALANELVDVAHAERPVRHPHRQPVDRDLGHQRRGRELEVDRVIVEPQLLRQDLQPGAVLRERFAHAAAASSWKNSRIAFQTSSTDARRAAPAGRPLSCSARNSSIICVSVGRYAEPSVCTYPV